MRKLLLSFLLKERIVFYSILLITLFIIHSPILTLSESISKRDTVSPISKSSKTLVKAVTPTPTLEPTSIPAPTEKPVPTEIPTPIIVLSPRVTLTPQAIGGVGEDIWDKIALCESNGNWSINTGNGYFGGLQFSQGAWDSMGGVGVPSDASREEQITRGKILQEKRGWGVWGICAQRLGLN